MAPQTPTTGSGQQAQDTGTTMQQMQDALEQLNTKIAALEAENAHMQGLVNEAYAKLEKPRDKAKLEAPAKYDGGREGLTGFLTQMRVYLQYYPEKLPDESSKVVFASSRLEGKALRWFEPSL
ncbi:hypothetical protein C8A03DRAFT_39600 [Achaetomium macrosporum]|uniref:DUF4939 domain-containing protein n=1 Tax=Achaetomium macrosporum TaxID=79813 RepID=A0AAN7BZY4_9PEZI|nr:hypothetical protein C8A03DRAFT_39600 [Achaetomium macrosporum]